MNADEIERIIKESSLSEAEKEVWLNAFKNAAPEILAPIFGYLAEFPDKLPWITDILKRKTDAMKKKDGSAWNQILTEETLEIKKIIEK